MSEVEILAELLYEADEWWHKSTTNAPGWPQLVENADWGETLAEYILPKFKSRAEKL